MKCDSLAFDEGSFDHGSGGRNPRTYRKGEPMLGDYNYFILEGTLRQTRQISSHFALPFYFIVFYFISFYFILLLYFFQTPIGPLRVGPEGMWGLILQLKGGGGE